MGAAALTAISGPKIGEYIGNPILGYIIAGIGSYIFSYMVVYHFLLVMGTMITAIVVGIKYGDEIGRPFAVIVGGILGFIFSYLIFEYKSERKLEKDALIQESKKFSKTEGK
jgi:uncharacterized membrane protein required for colicin V production